jgi:chitinase
MRAALVVLILVAAYSAVVADSIQGKVEEKKKVVCYFGSWSVYRYGNGLFDVEDINPFVCTHVIFGFAGISDETHTIIPLDPFNELDDDYGKGAFRRFVQLKKLNPELKTILAIGGWNEGSEKYSEMASNATLRAKFVDSVLDILLKFGFDGLDFDWEYPANRGGVSEDQDNFISIVAELKQAFRPHGLLLTIAASCGKFTIDTAYHISQMNQYIDQIHLMCYDMHGAWEEYTGHHAALFANPQIDLANDTYLNVDFAVNYWLNAGADPSKLILGMPLYGRGFTLTDPNQHGFYDTAYVGIDPGPYTGQTGFWGYNEICEKMQKESGWTIVRDPVYMVPYAYRGYQWIGYDDEQSIALKVHYLQQKGLGGGMVWSIDTDDFNGICGDPYILTRTMYTMLVGEVVIPTPDPDATTEPPLPTPPSDICKEPGYVRDPENCSIFYVCSLNNQGQWVVNQNQCPNGLVFDMTTFTCNYPSEVPECQ